MICCQDREKFIILTLKHEVPEKLKIFWRTVIVKLK